MKQHNDEFVSLLKKNQAAEIANLIATYNPTYTDQQITAILSSPIAVVGSLPDAFGSQVLKEGVLNQDNLSALSSQTADYSTLIDRLRQVPYKNSVPGTLDHLVFLHQQSLYYFQQIANGLAGKLQEKYGMAREEAERQAKEFRTRNNWH